MVEFCDQVQRFQGSDGHFVALVFPLEISLDVVQTHALFEREGLLVSVDDFCDFGRFKRLGRVVALVHLAVLLFV